MTEFGRVITQNEHNLHNGNFQFIESAAQILRRNRQRIRKNPLKSTISEGFWSEWGDSNARSLEPKPMSELSARGLAHSLALSGTPAVPLWNSIGLFISATAFVFWDLCGIGFCVLKDIPPSLRGNGRANYRRGATQELRRINKE